MIKIIVSLTLLLVSLPSYSASDIHCKAYMLKREANGVSERTQRAVLNVMNNRMRKWNKSACQVLHMKGQYPYMIFGLKPVSKDWINLTERLDKKHPILDNNYIYFNTIKHPWGRESIKVGKLWFSK